MVLVLVLVLSTTYPYANAHVPIAMALVLDIGIGTGIGVPPNLDLEFIVRHPRSPPRDPIKKILDIKTTVLSLPIPMP